MIIDNRATYTESECPASGMAGLDICAKSDIHIKVS